MLLELQVDLLWHRVLRVIVCDSLHQASWIVTAESRHALRHAQATFITCFASGDVVCGMSLIC